MKKLFLFIFLISFKSFSQSIDLGNINTIKKTHFDTDKKELYVFYKDSLSVIDLREFKEVKNTKLVNGSKVIEGGYQIVSKNGNIFFIEHVGGGVYKLENNDIIRVDNSFTHKMTYGSSIFVQNDTIFRYGGYGYWSMRNFFTYFDDSTLEWEIVSPIGSRKLPKGSRGSTLKLNNNNYYVYGGETLNPINPKEFLFNDKVWKFNIKNKSWSELGDTQIDFRKFNFSMPYNKNQVFCDTNSGNIYVVDVINNSFKTFTKTTTQFNLISTFKSQYIDGVFYCITMVRSNGTVNLVTRNEDEFFGELISEEQLYFNNEKIYYTLSIIGLLLILIFSYFQLKKWRVKRNKIIVTPKQLIYKNHIIPFDEKSIQILNLFFQSDKEILSSDLMDIVENKELNYGHNTRVKNQLIEEINLKLKSLLGIDNDLITVRKSELDKRIKVYTLNKNYFHFKQT